jgi:hypothetical protein
MGTPLGRTEGAEETRSATIVPAVYIPDVMYAWTDFDVLLTDDDEAAGRETRKGR